MKKIILCDLDDRHLNLMPLSLTRPIALFRVGISTIAEKWVNLLGVDEVDFLVEERLAIKYGDVDREAPALLIASHIIPDEQLARMVCSLPEGSALVTDRGEVIAANVAPSALKTSIYNKVAISTPVRAINYVFDIFLLNGEVIREDFRRLTAGRTSAPLSETNTLIGPACDTDGNPNIFIEEGATVEGATLNVAHGPIYIGRDAEVMEGACLRGPLAVCEGAHVNIGAKVYGDTTIGPFCKVGGEVNNIVMFGYSNKSHDGFLGNAVIGEWCNIGAGVNASNLKNDYSKIRIWNYATRSFMRTDLQFCGLIMGDHSKIGINCMLNTATVMGVGVNLHGSGFPRTFIPSFSEGSPTAGFTTVSPRKFIDIAERVMARRSMSLTEAEKRMFEALETTAGE